MAAPVAIKVSAYSGYKAGERPVSFELDGKGLKVVEILDRWFGQEHDYFKVLADNGRAYLLRRQRRLDRWELVKEIDRAGERARGDRSRPDD